jgi:Ca2+-binding EF-hand superfamily protein
MKKILIAAAALMTGTALLAQTPLAPVAPPAPPAPMAHPMADKVMTRNEVVAMVREHFGRMDADKNGSVTQQEVMQGHMQMAERFKMKHPGGAWQGENAARMHHDTDPDAAFDRLDANKDGSVSRDEFAKAREERIERRIEIREKSKEGANSPKDGQEVRRHVMRMHPPGGLGARMIVMADANSDGQITLAEAEALALQHFDQMDANHDGQVTSEERRSGRHFIKQMREEKRNGS